MNKLMVTTYALLLGAAALTGSPAADAQTSVYRDRRATSTPPSAKAANAAKLEIKYPDAQRQAPTRSASKIGSEFKKLVELSNDNKTDEVIATAEAILANPKANAYERSVAAQFEAQAWVEKEPNSYVNVIKSMQRALVEDGLDNNAHFDWMYQLAKTLLIDDQYGPALEMLSRFMAESKTAPAEAYALQGNAYYRLNRFTEAVAVLEKALQGNPSPDKVWSQLLMASYFELDRPLDAAKIAEAIAAKSPDDKAAQVNLASIYVQADQHDKAALVYDRLRAAGKLTESRDYEAAFRILANVDGREKDAVGLINEGLAKGILKPSFDVYNFLGQTLYFDNQLPAAIAAWSKAAPMDDDGETYLNLAKVLVQEDKHEADAKTNARQALAKGVKKPGEAWMVIARAEQSLDNRPATIAAFREAAKYPETREQASKALRQMGGK